MNMPATWPLWQRYLAIVPVIVSATVSQSCLQSIGCAVSLKRRPDGLGNARCRRSLRSRRRGISRNLHCL
jgi:hypothetical protein